MTYKCPYCGNGINFNHQGCKMTNKLGTTLQDIEAKAERKYGAMSALTMLYASSSYKTETAFKLFETIRKYIEEN